MPCIKTYKLDTGVPVVLDGVVGSAAQQFSDVRPPAALRPVVQVQ